MVECFYYRESSYLSTNHSLSQSQKASDVMGTVSSSIPQEAKDFMQKTKEKVFDSDKLRSFSVFFGFGDTGPYSLIANPSKLCPRTKDNIVFFYLNYIVLTAFIFALSLLAFLMSPKTMIILALIAVAWFIVLKATEDGVKFLGMTITRKEASFVMMIISGIVAFYSFQSVFWVTLGTSSILSLFHALTRDASQHLMAEKNKSKPLEPDVEFQ